MGQPEQNVQALEIPADSMSRRWNSTLVGRATLLAFLVLAAYWPALSGGFIWDDDFHLSGNPRLASWAGLWEIWTSRWALYYPLTSTTFWVLRRLVGLTPWIYHLFNTLMHLGAALLLWRVLAGLRIRGAWLGAALFALHPIQVESVAWITELKNTQSLVFLLLSLLLLEHSGLLPDNELRRRRWYTLSLACFLAALLSKSSTVMLPPVLLVLLWWRGRLASWRDGLWTAPYFAAALLMAGWTIWEQRYSSGAQGFEWSMSLPDRLVTAARLLCFYVAKLAWPDPLMFLYPSMRLSALEARAWMPLLSVVTVFGWLAVNARTWIWSRAALAAGLYFVLMLFPVLGFFNVYFMRYAEAADHFAYLASIGPLALAGALLATAEEAIRRRGPRHRWGADGIAVAGAAAIVLLALLTWRYTHVFHSSETLWRDAIAKNPQAWMAHNNLGLLYQQRGNLTQAEMHYRAALSARPDHYEAQCNLAATLMRRGDFPGATVLLERALSLRPDLPQALVNLGTIREKVGDRPAAKEFFTRALMVNPGYGEAHVRLAALAELEDDAAGAIAHYRFALEAATPDAREHAKFYNQKAAAQIQERRWSGARLYIEEALRCDPQSRDAFQLQTVLTNLEAAVTAGSR